MNTLEIIKKIKSMTKEDFESVYFTTSYVGSYVTKLNDIKDIFKKLDTNQYEFVTEFITNYWTFYEKKYTPILYKPIDSDGYDGIFLDEKNKEIYLSETKSSNKGWNKTKSNINTRLDEAFSYIRNTLFSLEGGTSRSVKMDHNNLALYIKQEYTKTLNDSEKEKLLKRVEEIQEQKEIGTTISAAVAKSDTKNIREAKKNEIITAIIVENLKEYEAVQKALKERIRKLYGL